MITLSVNGEQRQVPAATVAELVGTLGLDDGRRRLAVALNGALVTRTNWAETALNDGDRVEIVRAVSGG